MRNPTFAVALSSMVVALGCSSAPASESGESTSSALVPPAGCDAPLHVELDFSSESDTT
jgi:hypothetical protein